MLFDIAPPDQTAYAATRAHQSELTKPAGALGRLDDLAGWLAACQGRVIPVAWRPAIAIFAGDHGVTAQGTPPIQRSAVTRPAVKSRPDAIF